MSTCLLVEDLNKRIIKKNCASSWSPTRSYIEMHGQQNVKAVNMVWILNNDWKEEKFMFRIVGILRNN